MQVSKRRILIFFATDYAKFRHKKRSTVYDTIEVRISQHVKTDLFVLYEDRLKDEKRLEIRSLKS